MARSRSIDSDCPAGNRQGSGTVPRAIADEPRHAAIALVILGSLTRFRGTPLDAKFGWPVLACPVLIDADHLPLEVGSPVLTAGIARPYFHALWMKPPKEPKQEGTACA